MFYSSDSDDYAVPDVTKSAVMVTFSKGNGAVNNLDKSPPRYDALYAAADLLNTQVPNIPSLQVWCEILLQHMPMVYIRIMCPCVLYPLTPHFYIATLGFTGVYIIFFFLL